MIEIMQHIIDVLVNEVLAPAVARTGDLDGVVQNVKFSVANYVHDAGLPPEILAKHFGKSERSIYRYFEQMEKDGRRGGSAHEGVQMMTRILEFYYSRKDALPPEACIRHLRRHNPSVSPSDVTGLLDLYATMGHLRKITEEEGGSRVIRYQAPEQAQLLLPAPVQGERLKLMSKKLRALLPLLLAYARHEQGSSMILLRGRVLRRHLASALSDINDYTIRRWAQAREASERDDPEGREESVEACTLVLGGPGALEEMHEVRTPHIAPFSRIPQAREASAQLA